MVHFCLRIASVLFTQFQQIQALLKSADTYLNETLHREAFLLVLYDRQWLLKPHIRLIKQVIKLVIIDLKIAAS